MDVRIETLNARLREWKQDVLDLTRSRSLEQDVLDILDAPPSR